MEISATLAEECARVLGNQGPLSALFDGYQLRQAQLELAQAIARAIDKRSVLVAEAGTGTGKTFAYLVPALLHGKKAIISTATKTLQDQLFQKDLPLLVKAMGQSLRMQNLKGRSNYICRHRVDLHSTQGVLVSEQSAADLSLVNEKIPLLNEGDRSELPEIKEDSPVWPLVTSNTENCLGGDCPEHSSCFLMKARKRALEADIVVINHHLFFADTRLKDEGFGELLPGADLLVFDEAHQLADIAVDFYSERLGTRQFLDFVDDLIKEWPVADRSNHPFKQFKIQSEMLFDQMLNALPEQGERYAWSDLSKQTRFQQLWQKWQDIRSDIALCLEDEAVDEMASLKSCRERFKQIEMVFARFSENQQDTDKVRWVERFKHTMVFNATPFEVKNQFSSVIEQLQTACVFTSATLTMADSFECFTKPLGLDNAETLLLPSPFDFASQAMLYLPRTLPDPKDKRYHRHLLTQMAPVIKAFGGRCFFLFTSHRALNEVAAMIGEYLDFPILVQGEESKSILLARFRQYGNAVLLGTASFWEGVDVKGEALSCVIIDKLPFASPADPVLKAKMAYLQAKGLSAFDVLTLPNAVIALKQGVGRLIRDHEDKGLLVIADPRLVAREYGRLILQSLPKLSYTRDRHKVLKFIKALALEDEYISS